jgi:hypothetical protein
MKIEKLMLRLKNRNPDISVTFVRNNAQYGNEYILRKYADYTEDLLAMIEHGIYFGNNKEKVGRKEEWDLGSIITFGDYRKNIISKVYPNYKVVCVGPLIHYA